MIQVARQLTDEFDGPLRSYRYLIMDRDDKYTPHLKAFLRRTPTLTQNGLCVRSKKNAWTESFRLDWSRSVALSLNSWSITMASETIKVWTTD